MSAWLAALDGNFPEPTTISPVGSPELTVWASGPEHMRSEYGAWYRPDFWGRLAMRWGRSLKRWIDPEEEMKLIYVPKRALSTWSAAVRQKLEPDSPRVSSSDVLAAWLTKVYF